MRALAGVAVGVLSGACMGSPGTDVARASEEPLLAFHLTQDEHGPHVESREFEGRRIYLDRQPVISDPDILDVKAELRGEGVMLDVELRPDAAERMPTD